MMNVKISQKHDNVYYIRKNYVLKSIYDYEMNASIACYHLLTKPLA